MFGNTKSLDKWREDTLFISLLITVVIFPFSEALVSIMSVVLLLQVILLRSWRHPESKLGKLRSLLMLISVFVVYLVGSLFTNDPSFALYELNKNSFWVILPLAIYLSPKIPGKRLYLIFHAFILAVFVASVIIISQFLFSKSIYLSDFRSAGFISHIRFSYQVILSLILLSWFTLSGRYSDRIGVTVLAFISILLLTFSLIVLKSLLGLIAFIGTFITAVIISLRRTKKRTTIYLLVTAILIFIAIPVIYLTKVAVDYYSFKEISSDSIDQYTLSGNPYHHDFNNKTRENGNMVFIYICEDELRREWNTRSNMKYDQLIGEYPLSNILLRYLASKGLRKDSVGVSKLTDHEISLIESGVTNYKFDRPGFSLYPRIYQTVWEIDYYMRTGDPNNKSLIQRIEFAKASLVLIGENPLFGIGTGNWVQKYNEIYDKTGSRLTREKRGSSHNQYLNYLVKFGIIGFLWIAFAILSPLFFEKQRYNVVLILFLVSYAFANLGDSNLETHMGLSLFTLFYSLFLWHSPDDMKQK